MYSVLIVENVFFGIFSIHCCGYRMRGPSHGTTRHSNLEIIDLLLVLNEAGDGITDRCA